MFSLNTFLGIIGTLSIITAIAISYFFSPKRIEMTYAFLCKIKLFIFIDKLKKIFIEK